MPYKGCDPVSVAVEVIKSGLRPPIDSSLLEDVSSKRKNNNYLMDINYFSGLIRACWAQDPNARISFQEIMNHLRNLSFVNPLQDHGGALRTVDAPTGNVFLVSTVCFLPFLVKDTLLTLFLGSCRILFFVEHCT